jgi:hydrogenase/urease accessory protein HupE
LGIEHLLAGLDHVLFVIALMVLIKDRWRLIATVTAFTVAHSITLALSTFELLQISQSAVEALIALSLLFMAVEMLSKTSSITSNYPWAIAFGFGLIHGLGFAGVLREVGLPDDAALWALLLFNVGLEIGQLMVVVACLFLGFLFRYWRPKIAVAPDLSLSNLLPAYFIGPISVWWLLQRLPILS